MKMSDVFNLPIKIVEPVITSKGAWPVICASVEGESIRGHIGRLEIKQGPYTGTDKYLNLELAEQMASGAAHAINNHDRLEQENAELRGLLSEINEWFKSEHIFGGEGHCDIEKLLNK